jgi:hypothetical protein
MKNRGEKVQLEKRVKRKRQRATKKRLPSSFLCGGQAVTTSSSISRAASSKAWWGWVLQQTGLPERRETPVWLEKITAVGAEFSASDTDWGPLW